MAHRQSIHYGPSRAAEGVSPSPTPTPRQATPEDLGKMWGDFDERVVQQLGPIIAAVGVGILVLVILARIVALVPPFRDLKRGVWCWRLFHHIVWIIGLVAVVVVPVAAIWRGLWLMRGEGPRHNPPVDTADIWTFTGTNAAAAGTWWIFLGVAVVGVIFLGVGFATRRGTKILIKKEGTGLDATRIMATLHTMISRPGRGYEYVVGTDVSKAAESITALSDNKFAAMIQAIVKGILGSAPWELTVENENENEQAASVSIIRNGKVLRARRVALTSYQPFAELTERTKGDKLAALVAAEFVATIAERYPRKFRPGLYGATKPTSIGMYYAVSQGLELGLLHREDKKVKQVLLKAATDDPDNRAARAAFWNIEYRSATGAKLRRYAEILDDAMEEELWRHRRHPKRDDARSGARPPKLPDRVSKTIRKDELLLRLAQTRVAVSRNITAVKGENDDGGGSIFPELIELTRSSDTPSSAKRRMVSAISAFTHGEHANATVVGQAAFPTALDSGSSASWVKWHRLLPTGEDAAIQRAWLEERVLLDIGEFRTDPRVCYDLACSRVIRGLNPESPLVMSIDDLLRVGLTDRSLRKWAADDPELKPYRTNDKKGWEQLMETVAAAEPSPAPETRKSVLRLVREALAKYTG